MSHMEQYRRPSLQRNVSKIMSKQTFVELVDGIYKNIMLGHFENCPSLGTRMIKIFLSSTFADMAKERNVIMKYLYPDLRLYCRQNYGIEFQILDMRWGVPSETQLDHRGPELCFQEILNCKEISCGINFITIVGHRYGTISLPYSIKGSNFSRMVEILDARNIDTTVLREWYKVDYNNDPPLYTLRPIPTTSEDPTYEEIKVARQNWTKIETTLTDNITKATDILIEIGEMNSKDKKKFCSSVTEQEIEIGICNEKENEVNNIAAAFIREIIDIDTFLDNPKVNRYIDVKELHTEDTFENKVKVVVDEFLHEIMHEIIDVSIRQNLRNTNIRHLKTTWNEMNQENNDSQYLTSFKTEFSEVVKYVIDKNMKESKDASDDLYNEVLQHSIACVRHVKHFQGRVDLLDEIKNFIQGESNFPFIVYGESGSGKTSIMAKSAFLTRSWLSDEEAESAIILLRFLGTSIGTSNIRKTIKYLCRQLFVLFGEEDSISKVDDFKELFQTFYHILIRASDSRKIIIFLDSIDQLQPADGAYSFSWLMTPLPSNVRVILSTLPHHDGILDNLRMRFGDVSQFLEVKQLEQNTCMDILLSLLREKERTITEQQSSILREAFAACSLPIYVNLVFKTVLKWRSYYTDTGNELVLKYTVREAIFHFFRDLEKLYNRTFVRHSLAYITASRNGLSESELEDILSLDDKVLQSVFIFHLPPQIRVPPFLWSTIRQEVGSYLVEREADNCRVLYWYHRQFIEVAHEYLLGNKQFKTYIHDNMADYFLGTYSNNKPKRFYYPPYIVKKQNLPPYTDEGRNMPIQPLIYNHTKNISIRHFENLFNYRKINELPWHLAKSGRLAEFGDHIAFNYDFILAKLITSSRSSLMEDLSLLNEETISYKNSFTLLYNAIRLSTLSLSQDPFNISFDLIGRLSKYDNQSHPRIVDLLEQSRKNSHLDIGFIPVGQCLESGSDLLHLWYDIGLSMGIVLPNNQLMAVSMIDMTVTYFDSDGNISKSTETDLNIFMTFKMMMNRRPVLEQPNVAVVLRKKVVIQETKTGDDNNKELETEKFISAVYHLNIFSGRLTEVKEIDRRIPDESIMDVNDKYIQIDTRTGEAKLFNYLDNRFVYEYPTGAIHACLGQDDKMASVMYRFENHVYMDVIKLENEQITNVAVPPYFTALCCYNSKCDFLITMLGKGNYVYFYRYNYIDDVIKQYDKPIVELLTKQPKRVRVLIFNNANIVVFTVQISTEITEGSSIHGYIYNEDSDSVIPLVIHNNQSMYRKQCKVFGESVQGLISENKDVLITTGEKCILMSWSLIDGNLLRVITMGTAEGLLSGIFSDINKVALCHFPDESFKNTDERMYILEKVYNIDELKKPMNISESLENDDIEILQDHIVFKPDKVTLRDFSSDPLDGLFLMADTKDTFIVDTFENHTIKSKHVSGSFLNITLLKTDNRVVFRIDNVNLVSTDIVDINKENNLEKKTDLVCLDSTLTQRLNPRQYFVDNKQARVSFGQLISDWFISFKVSNETRGTKLVTIEAFNAETVLVNAATFTLDVDTSCGEYNASAEEKFRIRKLDFDNVSLRSNHPNQVVIMFSSKDRKYDEILRNTPGSTVLWPGVIIVLEITIAKNDYSDVLLEQRMVSFAVADIARGLALMKDGLHGINYKLEKIDIITGKVVGKVGILDYNSYILDPLLIDDDRYILGTKWIGPQQVSFAIGLDDTDNDPEDMFASLPARTIQLFDISSGKIIGSYPFENDPETIIVSRNSRVFSIITLNEQIKCIKLNEKNTSDLYIESRCIGTKVGSNNKKVNSSYGYLKLILTQVMREIVDKRPSDPIEYLASYLIKL